jgi:hypothetical protein
MALKSLKGLLVFLAFASLMAATRTVASAPTLPNPVLFLTGTEAYSTGGKQYIRYNYAVFNRSEYPDAMFAAAPNLPPCGKNTKASRTWVDFYDQSGKRQHEIQIQSRRNFALGRLIPVSW